MAIDQIVRINNVPFSWTSCLFLLDRLPVIGFTKVDLKEKRDRKAVRGSTQDGKPLGFTDGRYEVSGLSLVMLRQSWDAITTYATQQTGTPSFGDWIFALTVQVSEPAVLGINPITSTVSGCRFGEPQNAHEEGIDELLTAVECVAEFATHDGKRLWSGKSVVQ